MFRQKKRAIEAVDGEVGRHIDYPYRMNLYTAPPLDEITQDEFEQWGLDRLRVLQEIDNALTTKVGDLEKTVRPTIQKFLPLSLGSKRNSDKERKKDHYSHFILRLAFCRSEELRKKFVRLETELFKLRFATDDFKDRNEFLESLEFNWEIASPDEVDRLRSQLLAASGRNTDVADTYYKVDFTQVPYLVESRRVFLKGGKAYVPETLQLTLLTTEYSKLLDESLIKTARAIPRLDEEQRLIPILENLAEKMIWQETSAEEIGHTDTIRANMIDGLAAQKHFPLCMLTMQRKLKTDHVAKYTARRQYGLFLKGIGMGVEDALVYWRSNFAPRIADDKFDKEYRYNIRYLYGLEGSRRNQRPFNCIQIINGDQPRDREESHGCPYKYLAPQALEEKLQSMGITDKQSLSEIRSYNESSLYHLSCTKVYELTHPNDKSVYSERIMTPQAYFQRSWNHAKETPSK